MKVESVDSAVARYCDPGYLPVCPENVPAGVACPAGLIVVDKPKGLTSNQVSSRIRRLAGQKKVGYAGTLDPMATGLLIMAIGRATRLLQYLTAHDKQYLATVRFGIATDTDDAEGTAIAVRGCGAAGISPTEIAAALKPWRGEVKQLPSKFSALKINGKRAYDLARRGEDVELKERTVEISQLELLGQPVTRIVEKPEVGDLVAGTDKPEITVTEANIVVDCSAGTYIRALARDLGYDLGVGAHLTALRRTRVGKYTLGEAVTLEDLSTQVQRDGQISVITLEKAISALFPVLELAESQARALSYGQRCELGETQVLEALSAVPVTEAENMAVWAAQHPSGKVIALVRLRKNRVVPVWVIHPEQARES